MYDFKKSEEETLRFWNKNKIFDKLRKKNKGKRTWSFIDGPITANNPMGVHHAWGRTYKDLFHRFKAMNGFYMRYQNGFDCQGLWVEREEEKDLGLKDKSDIEKFGILNFVRACRKRVEKFSKIQTEQSIRLGQWMDWDNSYYTMSDNNQLHNWHLLKHYYKKGWLYKGKDAVPWCWRCGTASSKHDIVTEGYKEVTHKALFMKFPLKNKPNEYFLIFTTTPWTVPANVAIAVNPNVDYVKIETDNLKYWLALKRLEEIKDKYKILEKKKGSELEGTEYEMPYSNFKAQKNSPHRIVLWDLASEEEGTGIVHIAPGCGAEDFELSKKEKLPAVSPLDEAGVYKEGYDKLSFKKYSEVNGEVLKDLEERGFVYKIDSIKHRYPHCWRCGNELVFRLVDEWYIKHKEIKPKLIAANKKIKWYPKYGQKRQEDWFNNMGDWLISQKRYWGLPLPIWKCQECNKFEVIGSLKELKEKAVDKKKVDKLPEIHRPWIDEIKIKCSKCEGEASRIPDLGMAWLDAGIVMFSTLNYLQDKKYWKKWYPADFITENLPGQYRGWFNAIMWAGVALTGKAPFKSLFGYETLKDEKGEEMHKSKGNAIWFDDAVEKIGADIIRLLYCLQDPSQELRFGFNVVREPRNQINIFYNLSKLVEKSPPKSVSEVEDVWILSKLNSLIKKVTEELENLHPHLATRALKDFWLNDFSRGYIQIVRGRLSNEDKEVKYVLKDVYLTLIKLCAPVMPFITENIWQDLRKKRIVKEESIHLISWPKTDKKKIDKKLEGEMKQIQDIISVALMIRDEKRRGIRWPYKKLRLDEKKLKLILSTSSKDNKKLIKEFEPILKSQLNVKEVIVEKDKHPRVLVKFDGFLKAEGYARELSRKIQAFRKKLGLEKKDRIELGVYSNNRDMVEMFEKNQGFIEKRTNSKKMRLYYPGDLESLKRRFKNTEEFTIRLSNTITIGIRNSS